MIDVRLLRSDLEAVVAALSRRHSPGLVEAVTVAAQLDEQLRELTHQRDALRAQVNDAVVREHLAHGRRHDGPLALAVEMIAKYGFGREVEMLGPEGFLTLTPTGEVEGINISRATVIAHGWFYVVYLFASFRVWSNIRWPLWRFFWLASGGLFPVFSFFLEHFATRALRREIAAATRVESGS